jgi:hypothetical protein
MARLRGEEPLAKGANPTRGDTAAVTSAETRRDLLPDIEEINSTLRSNSDRSPEVDPGQTAQLEVQEKRSTRRGFTLSVVVIAFFALAYVLAPSLIEAAPQLEPALSAYTATIDGLRDWLNMQMASLLLWLDAAAASSAAG